ncbi:MAG: adenylyltransferase/cytidyltransferase family protein [Mycoplasma sp.]
MSQCIFPGSFNPFHEGHIDVIRSALKDGFEKIYIVLAQNPDKCQNPYDTKIINSLISQYNLEDKIEIICSKEKTIPDLANQMGIEYIVRGYRDDNDYQFELELKNLYLQYNSNLKFKLYLSSDENFKKIRGSNL